MNTRKILCIGTIIAILLLAIGITVSIGSEDSNTYKISATKTSVVKDDIVDVTLMVNSPKSSRGTQGRVEYDSNLELLSYEQTNDYNKAAGPTVQTDTDRCLVGFSTASSDPLSGELTALKLKLKVTGLEGGTYKVAWTDYDEEGNFHELSSVTLNRTDVLVPQNPGTNGDENNGAGGNEADTNNGSGTTIDDIIDSEINGGTGTSGNDNQGSNGSSSGTGSSANGGTSSSSNSGSVTGTTSSSNGGNTFIPQTGENTYLIIATISAILMVICVYVRTKKLKF